jgi:iron complex outermembrane recepter protein
MIFKTNKLRDAIAFALLSSVCFTAYAQDESTESTESEEQLDEVVVTGSRIKSQTITASSPVTEIGQEEFKLSGTTRPEDLVNQYPQLTPAFDSQQNNPSTGYATVSLRNLGAARTLTLINGRRLPPGAAEVRDISIIPSALVSRVDVLTGGASAVYGSDAVAGVVNFVLDTEFEGFSASYGYSAYQHKNDNDYIQDLVTRRNFPVSDGDSGFDGQANDFAFAFGSSFADGMGHAMGWLTYRENDALFHGQRDYSGCALNAAGTACGGSGTNAFGNFQLFGNFQGAVLANINQTTGRWQRGFGPAYNYAPPNFYQRPDERFTGGTSIKFTVNDHFKPYMEAMFVNRTNSVQIAESGTFFAQDLTLNCNDPLLGTACADLGINPATSGPLTVYVGRRNIEGGPRRTDTEDTTFRMVLGTEGAITDNWSYDASFLFAQTANDLQGFNDFLSSRVSQALLGCPAGSFAGCLPYNVWRPGQVTSAAANALAGTSFNKTSTELQNFTAFVTGDTGFGFASAGGENVSLVAGIEARREQYAFIADNDSTQGNFAGAGAAAPAVDGLTEVSEFFLESAVPVYAGDGLVDSFNLDLGYRLSDYENSGNTNSFKVGFTSDVGMFRFRGGFNRAIRAPGINNLFAPQNIGLFAGADPCAGATPVFTAAQCARTGVSAAQYGNISQSPAGQNNQLTGGNPLLKPEEADTITFGFAVEPIDDLAISLDYYDIQIKDTIATIGSPTILNFCATTGDPFLCSRIRRNPRSGDIWLGSVGFVQNLTDNFGELGTDGLDLNVNYGMEVLGGRLNTSFVANYVLSYDQSPLPGVNDDASFNCEGLINPDCGILQDFRAITSVNFSRDFYSINARLRHFGSVEYRDGNGALATDTLLAANGGIGSYTYLDLSGSVTVWDNMDLSLGINNILDKEPPLVGVDNATNANAPAGYDQLGRYVFARVGVKF